MRILILGGDGMLGHQLVRSLSSSHEVKATVRQDLSAYPAHVDLLKPNATYSGVDVRRLETLIEPLAEFRPAAVVNAVGIVKQREDAKQALPSLQVNALFPHELALLARAVGARVVHISTDCVFSGRRGGYTEQDPPDAEDLYGRTKLLGELEEAHCLTIRTSMIGLELARKTSLVEWFLAQRSPVRGFRRAIFSGLTTTELGRVIERLLTRHRDLSGIWHVAAEPISKYALLKTLAGKLRRDEPLIEPDDGFVCDRSLSPAAFERATGYKAPGWDAMLGELAGQISERSGGR